MTEKEFQATDWETAPKHAIYRDKVFPILRVGKWEKLLCLLGVYHPKGESWVRCENTDLCHHPELRSACHDSPVTTYHTEGHPSHHECSWCLTACKTKEANPSSSS
jgi:hypothetical protein